MKFSGIYQIQAKTSTIDNYFHTYPHIMYLLNLKYVTVIKINSYLPLVDMAKNIGN